MDDLPPPGSKRRKIALWFWALFTLAFVSLFVWGLLRGSAAGEFPVLAAIGGVLGLIGIWRWIAERSRA